MSVCLDSTLTLGMLFTVGEGADTISTDPPDPRDKVTVRQWALWSAIRQRENIKCCDKRPDTATSEYGVGGGT